MERLARVVPVSHGGRPTLAHIPSTIDQGGRRNHAIFPGPMPAEENVLPGRQRFGRGARAPAPATMLHRQLLRFDVDRLYTNTLRRASLTRCPASRERPRSRYRLRKGRVFCFLQDDRRVCLCLYLPVPSNVVVFPRKAAACAAKFPDFFIAAHVIGHPFRGCGAGVLFCQAALDASAR